MSEPTVSTGRGGAGNIGRDATVYTDAGIVREGILGESADGEYSSGRGGAGNIGAGDEPVPVHHAKHQPKHQGAGHRTDDVVVPEPSVKEGHYPEYHTGRGGQGNVHKDKYAGHSSERAELVAEGETSRGSAIGEKIKHALHLGKD